MKTLIITEKPKVSQRIAQAISGNYSRKSEKSVPYYEVKLNGDEVLIASAAGHLYSLEQQSSGWDYPVFDVAWAPLYEIEKDKAYVKKYIEVLSHLGRKAEEFIIATDWDIEGELLGYNALRFACAPEIEKGEAKRMKRMQFSALTAQDLSRAFKNPGDVDIKLVAAGEARHIMDWYWGINTSRALTLAAKSVNRQFVTISAGRVQTPALATLVAREKEVAAFVPRKYWEVFADLQAKGEKVVAQHEKGRFFEEAEKNRALENSNGRTAIVKSVEKKEVSKPPPFPFDLTTLQTEAYRCFGFSPKRTQDLAQSLYEAGYISYPRTSSQKLPPTIGYEKILRSLSESPEFKEGAAIVLAISPLKPREGPKSDPAHPAIYPTGILPKELTVDLGLRAASKSDEEKLYKLVARRFIAVFGDAMVRESVSARCEIGSEGYKFSGETTKKEGWSKLYSYLKFKEAPLPALAVGDALHVLKVYPLEKETQPPPRFNPASIVKELERRGLGTKATRAEIVDTLYRRGYIQGNPIQVTEFGFSVIASLEENVPEMISEELTRRFEEKIEKIQSGEESRDKVLEEARKELTKIMQEFRQRERSIGEKLVRALEEKERRELRVGACPKCGSDLRIIKSKKTGKIFIGCSGYPKCSTSFPLPQVKGIKTTDKKCSVCGLPTVSLLLGKRRVLSCIDMNCKSKESYRKKSAQAAPARES